jgi:G:T-mismatch repair DNA endonuclease (very short patch repair protein)
MSSPKRKEVKSCPESKGKTRTEFWINKIQTNKKMGWKVFICWGCQLKKDFNKCVGTIEEKIIAGQSYFLA